MADTYSSNISERVLDVILHRVFACLLEAADVFGVQAKSMLKDTRNELVWCSHNESGVRNTRLVAISSSCNSLNSTNRVPYRNAFLLHPTLQSFDCIENVVSIPVLSPDLT